MIYEHEWLDLKDRERSDELARAWEALCDADGENLPIARYPHLRQWIETFAPRLPCRALVVRRAGRWVAALPLVARRLRGLAPCWEQLYSDWTPTPQLLIDAEHADDPELYAAIARGLHGSWRPLLHLVELKSGSTSERLVAALAGAGLKCDTAMRYEIGQLNLRGQHAPENWTAYQKQLSGNFRRKIGKMLRRAESLGGVELQVVQPTSPEEVDPWLTAGFEIEDRSWKGKAGCSALRVPGMVEFYRRQAELLAGRRELTLLFLVHRGQQIAFQYGWHAGRTYYSPKIGYDEEFSSLSPGHLLMHLWIERMFAQDQYDTFDFAGPVSESTSGWITNTYRIERLWAGTGWLGNRLLASGQAARAVKHWLNARSQPADSASDTSDPATAPGGDQDATPSPAVETGPDARHSKSGGRPVCQSTLPPLDSISQPADSSSVVP